MAKNAKPPKFANVGQIRLLADSGTDGTLCTRPTKDGWIVFFAGMKAKEPIFLCSQREGTAPRFFKSADAVMQTAYKAGFKHVSVLLDDNGIMP